MRQAAGRRVAAAAVAALALGCGLPSGAAAGGLPFDQLVASGGIALAGSPYRWQSFAPRGTGVTVVARVARRGGEVSRWWSLRGNWHLTAPASDGLGAGLAGDESVLVLTHFNRWRRGLRQRTELAILATGSRFRHERPARHVTLPGDYSVYGVAPDGSTLFLTHWLSQPLGFPRFTIWAYDLRRHRLLPTSAIRGNGEILSGDPLARLQDVSGHRVYTLYLDRGKRLYLLALDTFGRALTKIELPRLRGWGVTGPIAMHLDPGGHLLTITMRSLNPRDHRVRRLARVDLRKVTPAPKPPPAPIGAFSHLVGQSAGGRSIELRHVGNFALSGKLLVFGCIHGDECGASALEPLQNGCPDPKVNAYIVPNLDPDGSARESRLNGRGVDLNRNFPAGWQPIGAPGSLEYGGPRPFSEPETRLAARLVRKIRPRVTIWFHQDWAERAYIRAWGQSAPAARRFAKLAGIAFHLMRWPAGTGPNWQNHRFPGSASFVVETPRGKLSDSLRTRLTAALSGLGEEVGDDPGVPGKR